MARGWGLGGAIPTEFELHYLDACPQLLQGQGFAAAGGDMWMGQGRFAGDQSLPVRMLVRTGFKISQTVLIRSK